MTLLLIAGGLGVLALPMAFAAFMYIGFKAPRVSHASDPSDQGMTFEPVKIPVKPGQKLTAWHLLASKEPQTPTVLILHGWGANMDMMLPLAQVFYKAGLNCLLMDARNHGHSPNDGISSLPQFADDCRAGILWLKQSGRAQGPLALLGHSVGAGAVILAAAKRDDVNAVISIASFAHPLWLMQRHLQRPYKSLILLRLLKPLVMAYTQWMIGHRFEDIAPMNAICDVKCPVLLVHGTNDRVIPIADMLAIENNCADHKPEILLIEGAGHESIEKIKQHDRDLVDFLVRHKFTSIVSTGQGKKS